MAHFRTIECDDIAMVDLWTVTQQRNNEGNFNDTAEIWQRPSTMTKGKIKKHKVSLVICHAERYVYGKLDARPEGVCRGRQRRAKITNEGMQTQS